MRYPTNKNRRFKMKNDLEHQDNTKNITGEFE